MCVLPDPNAQNFVSIDKTLPSSNLIVGENGVMPNLDAIFDFTFSI